MVTSLGGFHLAQPVSAAPELKEFSAAEYAANRAWGWQPLRSDERLYHGKDVNFQGSEWRVMIGAVAEKIYKIRLSNLSEDKPASDRVFAKVLQYLQSQMGKSTEHTTAPDVYIWDRVEGNTILEQRAALGYWGINVFLTSSFIKDLQ